MKKSCLLAVTCLVVFLAACGAPAKPSQSPASLPPVLQEGRPPQHEAAYGQQQSDEGLVQHALEDLCGSSQPLAFDMRDPNSVMEMFGCLRQVSTPCEFYLDGLKVKSWSGYVPSSRIIDFYKVGGVDHRGEILYIHHLDIQGPKTFLWLRLGNEVLLNAETPNNRLTDALGEMVASMYCAEVLGDRSQQCQEEYGREISASFTDSEVWGKCPPW